jgi:hypothetical protein
MYTINRTIRQAIQTASKQQSILLKSDRRRHLSPREAFILDLVTFIQDIERNPNSHCILMLDANEGLEDQEGGLRKLLSDTNLIETFSHFMEETCSIPTYTRGKKRLDFILSSQSLLPYVTRVGYLPFYAANNSDHHGLYLDLDESILDDKIELKRPSRRAIGSSSKPNELFEFKRHLDIQFSGHKIYDRAERVFNDTFLPSLPKKL